MELLDTLALKMGCEYLSDLRYLSRPNDALRRTVEDIPLDGFAEREWIDAAVYICNENCPNAASARIALLVSSTGR